MIRFSNPVWFDSPTRCDTQRQLLWFKRFKNTETLIKKHDAVSVLLGSRNHLCVSIFHLLFLILPGPASSQNQRVHCHQRTHCHQRLTVTIGHTTFQLLHRRVPAPIPHLNFCPLMSSASRNRHISLLLIVLKLLREELLRTYFTLTTIRSVESVCISRESSVPLSLSADCCCPSQFCRCHRSFLMLIFWVLMLRF